MIKEFEIGGVFLSPVLVEAVIAFAVSLVLRQLMARAALYRFVWHPALFDTAIFVIIWAVLADFSLVERV